MFEEKFNELSYSEKNQFGSIVNRLLLKGFIDLAVNSQEGTADNAQVIALSPIKATL